MQAINYKGYSLFNDVEPSRIRIANQAVVMANIYEDNCVGSVINKQGALTVLGYFNKIPNDDKKEVKKNFERIMEERGFMEVS